MIFSLETSLLQVSFDTLSMYIAEFVQLPKLSLGMLKKKIKKPSLLIGYPHI